MVGQAFVKLVSLLDGETTAVSAEVTLLAPIPIFDPDTGLYVPLPEKGADLPPAGGTAALSFTLHAPPPSEPEPAAEEGEAAA